MRERDVARIRKKREEQEKKKQQRLARSPSNVLRSPSRKVSRLSTGGNSSAGGEHVGEDGMPRRHKRVRSRIIVDKVTGERKKQVWLG